MSTATLNVRLPKELKEHGMQVLEREGVSVSELVRDIFKYLEQNQQLPDCIDGVQEKKRPTAEERRQTLNSIAGILPGDIDADKMRLERLSYKNRPGVRA